MWVNEIPLYRGIVKRQASGFYGVRSNSKVYLGILLVNILTSRCFGESDKNVNVASQSP